MCSWTCSRPRGSRVAAWGCYQPDESWRPYRPAFDVGCHVREVIAGDPFIEEERRRNKEWALEHFCAPELRTAFHAELSQALTDWFLRR